MKKSLLMAAVSMVAIATVGTACGGAGAIQTPAQPPATTAAPPPAATTEVPAMVRNGLPTGQHRRLDALVGEWTVEMSTFIAGGTPEKPLVSRDVVARWRWLDKTGGRFLQEDIEGTMAGGPYYRLGVLGFSTMDKRYEFNTVDAINATMMTYRGAANSGDERDITVAGEFTDQGVLGDAYVGTKVQMRTVIRFETQDRVVFDLHFTPPGASERLVDRKVYTRRK